MRILKNVKQLLIFIVVAVFVLMGLSLIPFSWLTETESQEQVIPSGLVVDEVKQVSKTYWNTDIELTLPMRDEKFEFVQSIMTYDSARLVSFSMEASGGDLGQTISYLTMEISIESMDDFLRNLSSLGKIEAIQTYTNNEALINQNVESWIENLSIQEKRYQELLKESVDLDETLAIEKELCRVRTELDDWQSLKRQSEQAIKVVTVNLQVSLTSEESWKGLIQNELFIQMSRISNFSKILMIKLVGLIPYLLIGLIVFLIGYGVFKKRK